MNIIGIPLNAPDKKTIVSAIATIIIAGIPAYFLSQSGLLSSRNAVLIVLGAIAGLLAPNMGLDPKKHGPKAWMAFGIFGILIFLSASLIMERIPGLKLDNVVTDDKKENKAQSTTPVKNETTEKTLTEIVVRPSDNERFDDRTITRSRFDDPPKETKSSVTEKTLTATD